MKRIHLLRVDAAASTFSALLAAAAAAGLRAGWLDLTGAPPPPDALAAAAGAGAHRAVAVGGAGSVAVYPRRGSAVLADLLRQHFLGCRLVLVRGGPGELPVLEANAAGGWRLRRADGSRRDLSTQELLAALRRPRL